MRGCSRTRYSSRSVGGGLPGGSAARRLGARRLGGAAFKMTNAAVRMQHVLGNRRLQKGWNLLTRVALMNCPENHICASCAKWLTSRPGAGAALGRSRPGAKANQRRRQRVPAVLGSHRPDSGSVRVSTPQAYTLHVHVDAPSCGQSARVQRERLSFL